MAPKRSNHSTPQSSARKPASTSSSTSASTSSTILPPTSTTASSTSTITSTTSASNNAKSSSSSISSNNNTTTLSASAPFHDVLAHTWQAYVATTTPRTKLVDAFLAFLVVLGGVQFVYCVVAGNYPFNAFLSGFSATVGQFVLTASLRMQSSPENKSEFKTVSQERAFADYVLGSLILHFFCINFIN